MFIQTATVACQTHQNIEETLGTLSAVDIVKPELREQNEDAVCYALQ